MMAGDPRSDDDLLASTPLDAEAFASFHRRYEDFVLTYSRE